MIDAPQGAFFVWHNFDLYYPWSLAKSLGREDLRIRGYSYERFKGFPGDKVVFDHSVWEHLRTPHEMLDYIELRAYLSARGKLHVEAERSLQIKEHN